MDRNNKRVNCLKCRYYYITWDRRKSRGCRAFGFKSQELPSLVVFRTSGQKCMKFSSKASAKQP